MTGRAAAVLALALAPLAGDAHAENRTLLLGNLVTHYRSDPEHNSRPQLLGLELDRSEKQVIGAATFRNSYDQRSGYVYLGRRFGSEGRLYAKATAGLLVGYRGAYRDRIPFNRYGAAPAVIPSFGVRASRIRGEIVLLAASGLMINLGYRF